MALQRKTLTQTVTAILEAMGYSASAKAPWASDAALYLRINEYVQSLPMRMNQVARELAMQGVIKPNQLPLHHDMWHTDCTSSTSGTTVIKVASGSSAAYMPTDYDAWISIYDVTNKKPVRAIEDPDRFLTEELLAKPPGPPQYLHIQGYVTNGSDWRRTCTIYPATLTGVTPSFRMSYYRVPAAFPGASPSAEYADIDPKYESVVVDGTVCLLARSTGFEYDRFQAREQSALVEMCMGALG